MKTVHYRQSEKIRSLELLEEADESLMIVAPHVSDALLAPLFELPEPLDINLLVSREAVAKCGRELRDHIKQLQDINLNIDVRTTDESFPAFAIVDGEHVHCFSRSSKRLAARTPDGLLEAADSLWARSRPLESTHQAGSGAVSPA